MLELLSCNRLLYRPRRQMFAEQVWRHSKGQSSYPERIPSRLEQPFCKRREGEPRHAELQEVMRLCLLRKKG